MIRIFAITLAALLTTTAFAQDLDFTTLDIDANGTLSFDELKMVLTELTEEQFATMDADQSTDISADEFRAYIVELNTTTSNG
jgi:Ca2+-binding EF-hand superfamily protein